MFLLDPPLMDLSSRAVVCHRNMCLSFGTLSLEAVLVPGNQYVHQKWMSLAVNRHKGSGLVLSALNVLNLAKVDQ